MVFPKRTVKVQPEDRLAQLLAVLEARTKLLAFLFGLCFVAALLVLAIWFPNPTSFQYTVFRITLALAAAGIAGVIPGMIRLKVQPGAALLIHAGGALAVFVIVYLFAPAALPPESSVENVGKEVRSTADSQTEKQTVLINNNQGGSIQINHYGTSIEEFEALLKTQLGKIEKKKQNADAIQRVLLEQQVKELQGKIANIQKSYEEELKLRKEANEALVKLKGKLPDEQIKQAQVRLEQGDKSAAEKIFDTIADNAGEIFAYASYQSGRLAEDRLDYAKAMQQYRKVVLVEERNPDYLLAAGSMAQTLGHYDQAQYWLKQLLDLRKGEGGNDANLASAQNSLSELYHARGWYYIAMSLQREALQLREELLGGEHPDTLTSINNLAELYQAQGGYNEAEPLFKQTLKSREKVLGREHPDTLVSINNLAGLYQAQGRYSEAESFYKQALRLRNDLLGPKHLHTLTSINNLAGLYQMQGRYNEAELLFKQAVEVREELLGGEHPDTLTSVNNLAALYQMQGRYSEAEALCTQAFQLREKLLGREHPDTLISINNLAKLYQAEGRNNEAEPLFKQTLKVREKVLGLEHPDTLASINNLANLYQAQDRYDEAEILYNQLLSLKEKALGEEHPDTLATQTQYIYLLCRTDRPDAALFQLKDLEKRLLFRSFGELYTSLSENVRRLYLQSKVDFQQFVFSLAVQQSEEKYRRYAAEVMLRWKQVYAEESCAQHRLFDISNNPEIEKLRTELSIVHTNISQSVSQGENKQNLAEMMESANRIEKSLLDLVRQLKSGLDVEKVSLDRVLSSLPAGSGLIEYRLFQPVDFKTEKSREPHLAALLLLVDSKAKQRFVFRDLGPFAEIEKHLQDKTDEVYRRLLGSLDEQIKKLQQLYIAPDGLLYLFTFASMHLPDGRFLAERQQINRLQTGRDLIENGKDFSRGKGLVAIGGAEYGNPPASQTESVPKLAASYQQRAAQMLRNGVAVLKNSGPEVETINTIFTNNISEDAQVFLGENASEYNLKHLKHPPRILHLSTHGFYLAKDAESRLADEAPLLLSGLALAGANNGLQGKLDKHGDDGLLYSLEVLGLNLQGTELVSLSACDTGKGVMDYSEGVYGLVRAFRTAGAKNVLMTLTPVGDKSSREFMETFYDNWLSSEDNISPAQALHKTRLDFIHHKNLAYRDPAVWSPYVMVGR